MNSIVERKTLTAVRCSAWLGSMSPPEAKRKQTARECRPKDAAGQIAEAAVGNPTPERKISNDHVDCVQPL